MHRSDPKRAFLVQQQISELGPEDAHRVFQQRLKYRLQFTGRRTPALQQKQEDGKEFAPRLVASLPSGFTFAEDRR